MVSVVQNPLCARIDFCYAEFIDKINYMNEEVLISGSSFLVNQDGTLLTNAHVVGSRKEMKVALRGQEFTATVIATDFANDLAALSTKIKNKLFFKFASADVAREDEVSAIGFGFGKQFSSDVKATRGIVSALSGIANNYSQFQTDAAIQVGNSGGPLINNSSEIVGIAVAKLDTAAAYQQSGTIAENVNFAIKVSTVKQFLDSNNIEYHLSEKQEIDLNTRNKIVDESVLYLFSSEKDTNELASVCAISSPTAGVLEARTDEYEFEELMKDSLLWKGEVLDMKDILSDDFPIEIWGDDLKVHKLKTPSNSGYYMVIRTLYDDISKRVEKDQPLVVLRPASAKEIAKYKKEQEKIKKEIKNPESNGLVGNILEPAYNFFLNVVSILFFGGLLIFLYLLFF